MQNDFCIGRDQTDRPKPPTLVLSFRFSYRKTALYFIQLQRFYGNRKPLKANGSKNPVLIWVLILKGFGRFREASRRRALPRLRGCLPDTRRTFGRCTRYIRGVSCRFAFVRSNDCRKSSMFSNSSRSAAEAFTAWPRIHGEVCPTSDTGRGFK